MTYLTIPIALALSIIFGVEVDAGESIGQDDDEDRGVNRKMKISR